MKNPARRNSLASILALTFLPATALASPDYHLVGWMNAFLPGSGQAMLGNPVLGGEQAFYEIGSFAFGYSLSRQKYITLDGSKEDIPDFKANRRNVQENIEKELYADIIQEFGLKAHMVNTYNAYREAAISANGGKLPEGIDESSTWDLFLSPFRKKNLTDPWVYYPLAIILAGAVADYLINVHTDNVQRTARLNSESNFLYAFNYGIWQPIGSGAPEEMFYRGFLQNELLAATHTPWLAVPLSTAAFAFSHKPGPGRLTAAVAGGYLGLLAHKNQGKLASGVTLHFWSGLFLGLETILLNHEAQRTTPPSTFAIQINY